MATNKIYPELTGKKILVIGHARHGKDTIGDFLQNIYGMPSCSSSMFAAQNVVLPYMRKHQIKAYPNAAACYRDRGYHRDVWFKAIAQYNEKEPHRLATDLLETYDVYTGMRSQLEFNGCMAKGLFNLIIWVDAKDRKSLEPASSMGLTYEPSEMEYIENSLTICYAEAQLHCIMDRMIERDQW